MVALVVRSIPPVPLEPGLQFNASIFSRSIYCAREADQYTRLVFILSLPKPQGDPNVRCRELGDNAGDFVPPRHDSVVGGARRR